MTRTALLEALAAQPEAGRDAAAVRGAPRPARASPPAERPHPESVQRKKSRPRLSLQAEPATCKSAAAAAHSQAKLPAPLKRAPLCAAQTPAGHALFKVLDEGAVTKADGKDLAANFETTEGANSMCAANSSRRWLFFARRSARAATPHAPLPRRVKLKAFHKFEDTTEALASTTALLESKLDKGLKSFLKKSILKKGLKDELAVADSKVGGVIKSKMGIPCIHNDSIFELIRGVRNQITSLITGLNMADYQQMSLGLAHSLSRYKLKFSPDKVDVMIIQAIGLLDDLDKELNTYAMRTKEWYGWHFPEMAKIVADNVHYARCVKKMVTTSPILP